MPNQGKRRRLLSKAQRRNLKRHVRKSVRQSDHSADLIQDSTALNSTEVCELCEPTDPTCCSNVFADWAHVACLGKEICKTINSMEDLHPPARLSQSDLQDNGEPKGNLGNAGTERSQRLEDDDEEPMDDDIYYDSSSTCDNDEVEEPIDLFPCDEDDLLQMEDSYSPGADGLVRGIDVTVDSGAGSPVASRKHFPGIAVTASAASIRGQQFMGPGGGSHP